MVSTTQNMPAVNRSTRPWLLAVLILAGAITVPTRIDAQFPNEEFRILSPDGGEFFEPGDTVDIRFSLNGWRPVSIHDSLAIELSTDGGDSWSPIFELRRDFTIRDSILQWVVPRLNSNQCRLRLIQRSGLWGNGAIKHQRSIPTIPLDSLWEVSFRPTDSLLVINATDRIHIVDPWDASVPVRTLVWPFPLPHRRLVNIRFGRGDSLLLVGVMPNQTKAHQNGTIQYGALDFYTGDTAFIFETRASSGVTLAGGSGFPTRAGFTLDMTRDGKRVLRTHAGTTDIIDLDDRSVVVEVPDETELFRRRVAAASEFSPDERHVAVGGQLNLAVLDAETFDVIWERPAVDADFVAYSHDGRFLLVTPFLEDYNMGGRFSEQEHRILDAMTGDTIRTHRLTTWRRVSGNRGVPWYVYGAFASASNAYALDFQVYSDPEKPNRRSFIIPQIGSVALTPSGSFYAEVLTNGTVTIRDMGLASQPGDTTDAAFSIISSVPIAVNQFAGTIQVGQSHDTTVSGFLINAGKNPVRVESIAIVDGDVSDFSLTSGTGPYVLQPDERADLGIRFTPQDTGVRSVTVTVETENGPTEARIQGIGTQTVGVELTEESVDRSALSLSIQPNPVTDGFLLTVGADRSTQLAIRVHDASGRVILDETARVLPGENALDVDVRALPSGSYRCAVIADDGVRASVPIVIVR